MHNTGTTHYKWLRLAINVAQYGNSAIQMTEGGHQSCTIRATTQYKWPRVAINVAQYGQLRNTNG